MPWPAARSGAWFIPAAGAVLCTLRPRSCSLIGMTCCKSPGAVALCGVFVAAALAAGTGADSVLDLTGKARDPFTSQVRARVFIFVRTDCPITNRYAPELARL